MTEKTAKGAKPARAKIDWEAIETHYRAGIRSLKDIGNEYGCSDAAIVKKAKTQGWTRDLSKRIAAKAEAKVSAAAVSAEVSAQKVANQEQVVEANAELQYRIRMEHREDIGRTRRLFGKLLSELEITTDNIDLFMELGELLRKENDNGVDRMNDLYHKVISMGGRVSSAKQLAETLEKLVKMEREAFGIKSDEENRASPLDDLLKKIDAERRAKS